MNLPLDADDEDAVCELRTRLDSLEESLESLHDKLDIVLAAIDDRDDKSQQSPNTNENGN